MSYNDYFHDYLKWGLCNVAWLFVGSVFAFLTCCKAKKCDSGAKVVPKKPKTVQHSKTGLAAKTASETKKSGTVLETDEDRKKRYETANDIDKEMSLRHADMIVQEKMGRKSSEQPQKEQYEPLDTQGVPSKKPHRPSNEEMVNKLVDQVLGKQTKTAEKLPENKEGVQNAAVVQDGKETKATQVQAQAIKDGKELSKKKSGISQKDEKGDAKDDKKDDVKIAVVPGDAQRQKSPSKVAEKNQDTKPEEIIEPRKASLVQLGMQPDSNEKDNETKVDQKELKDKKDKTAPKEAEDRQRKDSVDSKKAKEEKHSKKAALPKRETPGKPEKIEKTKAAKKQDKPQEQKRKESKAASDTNEQIEKAGGKDQKKKGAPDPNPKESVPPTPDPNITKQTGDEPPKAPIYRQPYSRYFDPSIKPQDPSNFKKKDHKNYQSLFVEDE